MLLGSGNSLLGQINRNLQGHSDINFLFFLARKCALLINFHSRGRTGLGLLSMYVCLFSSKQCLFMVFFLKMPVPFQCFFRSRQGLPQWLISKECTSNAGNAGDVGSAPGSGRSSGGGNGNALQYSCLENSVDRGAWWATVHGATES